MNEETADAKNKIAGSEEYLRGVVGVVVAKFKDRRGNLLPTGTIATGMLIGDRAVLTCAHSLIVNN